MDLWIKALWTISLNNFLRKPRKVIRLERTYPYSTPGVPESALTGTIFGLIAPTLSANLLLSLGGALYARANSDGIALQIDI
jgi:hypothetical protein